MKTLFKESQATLSLTAALTIAFLAFGALVLSIPSGLQLFSNVQTQQTIISSDQQLIAQGAARSVSNFIQEKFSVLETAIWFAEPPTASSSEQKLMLDSLLGLQPAFQELVLLNAQDQTLAQVSRLPQKSPWRLTDRLNGDVLAGIQKREKYISPVYIDPASNEPRIIMAVPVTNILGDYKGSLVAEVNLRFIWDLVDHLKVGETGRAYVVDRQGNLIASGDTARVLKGENVSHLQTVSEFIHSPASAPAAGVSTYSGITGARVVGTYVPLGMPDWAVVTELPWQEAYREVIRQAMVSIGITLAMAVLAGIMGVYLARRLAVPLVHLMETAVRIAGGERELQAVISGPREVASLAMAFNSMTAQLRQSLQSLEQQVVEVKQAEESLRHANETLQALIDYSPLAFIMLDLNGHVLLWNNAAEEMYGWTAQETLGKYIPFIRDDQREEQRATSERITQGEVITNLELEHRRKDGSRILNGVSLAPLRDSTGSVYAYMSVAADITERKKAEEALQESEERLRQIASSLREVIWLRDAQTRQVLYVNPAFEDLTGRTCETFYKNPDIVIDAIHPDDKEGVIKALEQRFEGVLYDKEHRIIHVDGSVRWVSSRSFPVRNEAGEVYRWASIMEDITERKRAEEALRESEERYRILSGLTSDLTYAARVERDGTTAFEWAAGALMPITGYTLDELEAHGGWAVVIHHDDMPVATQHLQAHLADHPDVAEYRIMTKSGDVRWLRDYGYPVWDEAQKRVVRIIGAAQDITERKRAENLIRAERDLALTLSGTPNLEEGLRLCLKTALLLSGMDGGGVYRVDETSGALDLMVHHGLSSEFIANTSHYEVDAPNVPLVMAGKPLYTEYLQVGIPVDGIKRQESLRALAIIPIHHEDRVIGCLNVASYTVVEVPKFARDVLETVAAQIGNITVRMKAEAELRQYRGHLEELVEQRTAELKAANEQLLVLTQAKDEFVSNVSHELRTPIASVKLRQRLLRNHPDQLDQHLDVIKRETDRLAQTIEELLQLSRLDQRRVEFHPILIDLNQMVSQYVTDRVPIAEDKGLALIFRGEPELPDFMADAGLLGQALSILLTNAINYTPASGQVLVRTHARQDADKRWIGFSIADTGPGIPSDEQPRLFDRFFRGRIARKSGVPGTGLGLAIAQEIVKRHRGNIEVESDGTPGHGATFRVWIQIGGKADNDTVGG